MRTWSIYILPNKQKPLGVISYILAINISPSYIFKFSAIPSLGDLTVNDARLRNIIAILEIADAYKLIRDEKSKERKKQICTQLHNNKVQIKIGSQTTTQYTSFMFVKVISAAYYFLHDKRIYKRIKMNF